MMSSSVIYCSCSFCITPQQARTIYNGFVPASALHITQRSRSPISATPTITSNSSEVFTHSPCTGRITTRQAIPRHPEQLNFGIEKILYGSSNAELHTGRHNVSSPTPRRTNKRRQSLPLARPVFTDHQRMTMENRFQIQHYLTKRERYHLSLYLGLTEHQIKVWFQNRRVKFRNSRKAVESERTKLSREEDSVEIE